MRASKAKFSSISFWNFDARFSRISRFVGAIRSYSVPRIVGAFPRQKFFSRKICRSRVLVRLVPDCVWIMINGMQLAQFFFFDSRIVLRSLRVRFSAAGNLRNKTLPQRDTCVTRNLRKINTCVKRPISHWASVSLRKCLIAKRFFHTNVLQPNKSCKTLAKQYICGTRHLRKINAIVKWQMSHCASVLLLKCEKSPFTQMSCNRFFNLLSWAEMKIIRHDNFDHSFLRAIRKIEQIRVARAIQIILFAVKKKFVVFRTCFRKKITSIYQNLDFIWSACLKKWYYFSENDVTYSCNNRRFH